MYYQDVKSSVEMAKSKFFTKTIEEGEDYCYSHPKTKAIGSFVYREQGFTEYYPVCNVCVGTFVNNSKKFFTNLFADIKTGGTMYCECCKTTQDKYTHVEDGGIEDNLLVYKDPEDGSWTDMCNACYTKQKAADDKYYEEELQYQREKWGYDDDD